MNFWKGVKECLFFTRALVFTPSVHLHAETPNVKKEGKMKKILVMSAVILFAVSSVFAVPFSPTPLRLSASPQFRYNFDGTLLEIPVTVTGTPSNSTLMIYTKGKADAIGKVRNGFLAWHYVNRVDTCVYLSPPTQMIQGSNTITWNGKDKDGTKVPPGTYTYYLWGYDNQTPKILALRNAVPSYNNTYFEAYDEKGIPKANPIFYYTLRKWPVGIDPMTPLASLETTTSGRPGIPKIGERIQLDHLDHTKFWQLEKSTASQTIYITKYKWVPNGAGMVETDWCDQGAFTWNTIATGALMMSHAGVMGDGKGLLFSTYFPWYSKEPWAQIIFLTEEDGTQERILDYSTWYVSKYDNDNGGQMNGLAQIFYRNGLCTTTGEYTCMVSGYDPYRDPGDEVIWANGNGDVIHDHRNLLTATPWLCNDNSTGPWTHIFTVDQHQISHISVAKAGVVSFGSMGPDGIGIGYFAYSGETASGVQNHGPLLWDEGLTYDGMYNDNVTDAVVANQTGTWWTGYDSIKGVISNALGVDEAAPAAFSVAQNSPNPFNPTTSISFTLTKPGKVTVDIYNAAGQKIDTVVNTTMNAGNHSATWNASKFSAGVYFYTVKSGDFSKTMKMTLLR